VKKKTARESANFFRFFFREPANVEASPRDSFCVFEFFCLRNCRIALILRA